MRASDQIAEVLPRLCSKRIELHTVKIWIMQTFPKPKELYRVAIAQGQLF